MSQMNPLVPPPVIVIILAAGMWAADRTFASLTLDAGVLAPLALLVFAAGLLLLIASVVSFIKARTSINPLRPANASHLITTGVFSFSRNPIYLADLLLLDAWALWLGNIINVLFILTFLWYIQRFQIVPEEQALQRLFGARYADYCTRVRRWL